MRRRCAAALALVLFAPCLAPVLARAASAAADTRRDHWQSRARAVHETYQRAQARYRAAVAAYREARHRRHRRGESKAALIAERDRAKEALDRARRELEALPEEARRAGALPGWIRLPTEPDPSAPDS